MSLTYSSYISEIATITVISSTVLVSGDNNFAGIMGGIIDYAEGRIYRDLNLPITSVYDYSVTCTSGVRTINLSTVQGEPLVLDSLSLLTSAGATSSYAARVALVPASKAVIDMIYPSGANAVTGQPEFFARVGNLGLILGPTPDQAYGTEAYYSIRPNPLSASNSSTWLTQNYPELMIAAGMVFAAGYMRDFGSQSDNPQVALSWEGQYSALLRGIQGNVNEMNFQGQGWTAQNTVTATPPRP